MGPKAATGPKAPTVPQARPKKGDSVNERTGLRKGPACTGTGCDLWWIVNPVLVEWLKRADAVVPRVKWAVWVVGREEKNVYEPIEKKRKEKKRKEKKKKNGIEWRQDEEQKEETDAAIEERSEERSEERA